MISLCAILATENNYQVYSFGERSSYVWEECKMIQQAMWSMFLQTGAPEAYLLYCEARKAKEDYVSDNPGARNQSHEIQ